MAIAYLRPVACEPFQAKAVDGRLCFSRGQYCIRKLLTANIPTDARTHSRCPEVVKTVVLVAKHHGVIFRDVLVHYFQRRGVEEICPCVEETVLEDGVVVLEAEVLRIPLADKLDQYLHEFPARQF